jgi:hypothetical protein
MSLHPQRFDIFDGPDSDHERAKRLNTRGKIRSAREKQTVYVVCMKMMNYKAKSQRIVEQTQPQQKVLGRRKQRKYGVKTCKLKGGEHDKLRRSARLEAQRVKGVAKK